MIYGIGLDIIEVERIEKAIQKQSFLDKIFCESEIEMFESRSFSAQVVAGNFAAKEAALKALGLGMSSGLIRDIVILREASGKPYIRLNGEAEKYAKGLRLSRFFVSISNLKNLAIAQVVIEKDA
jgi:holo-[acyl-carrier protein] synthase